jgi:hypothetical protein
VGLGFRVLRGFAVLQICASEWVRGQNSVCEFSSKGGDLAIIGICESEKGNFTRSIGGAVPNRRNEIIDLFLQNFEDEKGRISVGRGPTEKRFHPCLVCSENCYWCTNKNINDWIK